MIDLKIEYPFGDTEEEDKPQMPIDLNPTRTRMKQPSYHQQPNPMYDHLNKLSERDREIRPHGT
jgi:hypothetical protein